MTDYRIEALDDSEIMVYSLFNSRQKTINEFTNVLSTALHNWKKNRPFLMVIDISYRDTILNPYAYRQLENTFSTIPDELRGAIAFIMPDNVFHTVAESYLNKIPTTLANIEHSMFKHRDLAIHWLIETSSKYYVRLS